MAAVDEDAAIDGAFEAFVGMLPQTGKYASLLQQRLAEAQGEEDDEENSSAAESSDQEGAERAANDCSSEDESASNVESVGDGASASGASDDDEAEGDADAEDDANSAEHVHDVFQRLYWGVGAAGGDDPEEDEFIEQLGEAKKLEARSIPLTAEQLGLGDTPEGHQTPFLQVTAKLPTLPDTSTAPFMAPSSSAPAAGSSRKRRRSTPAADSAVTCVDLSAAYNVGAKTAHQFALYHADRHLALKRAGEPVTDAALRGFDEQLTVRQGPEAKEARQAAFAAAVQAAAAAAKPHPLQPRTLASALLSPLQRLVLDNAHDYRDMVLPIESPGNMAQIRTSLALHVASHLQRTRNRVIKHDSKLRSAAAARRVKKLASAVDSVKPEGTQGGAAKPLGAADATDAGQGAADDVQEEEIDADALRDQGFARCRVVVLLPFKHMALQFVRCLLTLLGQGRTVHHRKRFMEEFGDDEAKRGQPAHVQNTVGEADWVEDDFSSERLGAEAAAAAAKKARKGKDKPPPKRPSEHNQQFAGDVDGTCCQRQM